MPFLLFESRESLPPAGFEVTVTVLTDTPRTVIFTLTVWKSYKSCALLRLISTGII
jgi:hypothetical protein